MIAALSSLKSWTSSSGHAPERALATDMLPNMVSSVFHEDESRARTPNRVSSSMSWAASAGSRSRSTMAATPADRRSRDIHGIVSAASGPAPGGGT